ncbi:hypothetical protein VKT23_000174 [Stygiomarasmius scandens]|uniref:Uncharacterized protein n=1 Tax=Marasmiellus scandens TaxID=2682957 RepID=A0ABR1K3B9_9AGAR
MDDSPTTDASTELVTIACRFVPYDQWLITHVDASWKVSQVKAWLLAKCYNSFYPPRLSASTPLPSSAPPIKPPERPNRKKNRRPASPIVFAPEPPNSSRGGVYDSDEDEDNATRDPDEHYYDEHGIYGAGDPDSSSALSRTRAGAKTRVGGPRAPGRGGGGDGGDMIEVASSVGKSSAGMSNISYVSQISGLTYASTASKASSSKRSEASRASASQVSPQEDYSGASGGAASPGVLPPIDTSLGVGTSARNTDTIRANKRKKGPKGPRRPVSPITFAPMGKSPTSGVIAKGGFVSYETYATYSPEEGYPGPYSLARGTRGDGEARDEDGEGEEESREGREVDMQSIESTSTTKVQKSNAGNVLGYKRLLGPTDPPYYPYTSQAYSSEDEGTVLTMGYEDEEDDDDDDAEEEDDYDNEEDADDKERNPEAEEDLDPDAPPPGTGRIGPGPPVPLVPNRLGDTSSSTMPGAASASTDSHTYVASSATGSTAQTQNTTTTTPSERLAGLFTSKKDKEKDSAKDKSKSKDKDKSKEKSKSKSSKKTKDKEKDKDKSSKSKSSSSKAHRSKLEKPHDRDRDPHFPREWDWDFDWTRSGIGTGKDRTKDWVESERYRDKERQREKERELFTSSISAMSGISTRGSRASRAKDELEGDRDRDRERERGDRDREREGDNANGNTNSNRYKKERELARKSRGNPSFTAYHPMLVTVIRFSTGQILEDHFALGWYELKPYELLEIHRKGVILSLPRTLTLEYISPYWEGSVRALRVVLRAPASGLGASSSAVGVGTMSVGSTSAQTGAGTGGGGGGGTTGASGTGGTLKGKDLREIHENRLRERIGVERHSSLRERGERDYERDRDRDRDREQERNRAPGAEALMTYTTGKERPDSRATSHHHGQGQGHKRKNSLGPYYTAGLGAGPGLEDGKNAETAQTTSQHHRHEHSHSHSHVQTHSQTHNHQDSRRRRPLHFDWRDRWVFIKDGVLNIWKDRDDPNTAQYLPLSDLTDVRGAEQLGKSLTVSSRLAPPGHQHNPSDISGLRGMLGLTASSSNQRIVCAKFKSKMRDGRGDDGKKKVEKEKEGQSLSLSLARVPEDSSTHGHGHGHAYRAPGSFPPSSQVPAQMTIVSTTISAGGRTRTSSQPVFSPPSSKQAGKPTSSFLRAKQQSQTTQLDRPLSISGASPPTSNPGSLSSSPTLRPFMAPPLSMRIQSPELLSAAVTSEKDREKERERLIVISGGSSSSKSTSFSQIANAENESSGYPYIKDKGKGKATSPSTPTASGLAATAPTMGTDDGHESDDEADEGMSDGNMSGSGFLGGGGAESPPFAVSGSPPGGAIRSTGVVRPLPSLPSTPAFPDRFSSAGSSPKSGIVAGTASKGKEGTPELEPAQEDTVKLGVHPRIETDLGDEDLSGFSSDGTLSSPVFAHSDSDSDINSMRRGYGYGFERRRKTKEERDGEGRRTVSGSSAAPSGGGGVDSRWRTPGDDGESDNAAPEADSSYVYVDDPHETAKEHHSRATSRAQTSRPKSRVKSREKESGGEWIVLDLQDEHAFRSFLRVLHRHAPHVLSSSFLSQLPSFNPPNQAPVTPTPTPVAGATSFSDERRAEGTEILPERLSRVLENPEHADTDSLSSSRLQSDSTTDTPTTATTFQSSEQSSSSSPALHKSLPSLSIPSSKPNFHHPSPLQALRSKRSHLGTGPLVDTYGTFGALPYPEWRTEVVTRAQRAGMGELTRAMEFLFQGDKSRSLGISSSLFGFDPFTKINMVTPTADIEESDVPKTDFRREQRKRGRKMTIEQENIAMGISGDSPADGDSIQTLGRNIDRIDSADQDSTDSGEESSDTEWLGWMADLRRQAHVTKETEAKKLLEQDPDEYLSDYTPQDDHRRYQEKQKLLEPTAEVVVTTPTQHGYQHSGTPPNPVVVSRSQSAMPVTPLRSETIVPQVLTSPSSNESLNMSGKARGRKLSFGVSPVDQSSSAVGRLERSNSRSRLPGHQRQASNSRTPNLLHFASTGFINSSAQAAREKEFPSGLAISATRRPSMPALSSTSQAQAQSAASMSLTSSPLNPQHSFQQQQQMPASGYRPVKPLLIPSSPGVENNFGIESSSRNTMPRRSSTAELPQPVNPSGSAISLGRSGSVISRGPGLLRKKDPDAEKARQKGKGKRETEVYTEESKDSRKPRLSLSMANSASQQNLAEVQTAIARTQSPPISPTSQSFVSRQIRRVRSGSSLLSGNEGGPEPKPSKESPKNNPPVKKNKGIMRGVAMRAERLISGLESTLDFVDARQ